MSTMMRSPSAALAAATSHEKQTPLVPPRRKMLHNKLKPSAIARGTKKVVRNLGLFLYDSIAIGKHDYGRDPDFSNTFLAMVEEQEVGEALIDQQRQELVNQQRKAGKAVPGKGAGFGVYECPPSPCATGSTDDDHADNSLSASSASSLSLADVLYESDHSSFFRMSAHLDCELDEDGYPVPTPYADEGIKRHDPDNLFNDHKLVNRSRFKHGLPPLMRCRLLDDLAREHAKIMAQQLTLSPSVRTIAALQVKLQAAKVAENVQRGRSVRDMHLDLQWNLGTPRNPAWNNIVSPNFADFGMGTAKGADGQLYMVQYFRGQVYANGPGVALTSSTGEMA